MAMRDSKEQKLHDTIAASLKSIYQQRGAGTVLDGEDASIKGVSLDLKIKNPFLIAFKIETNSTVTEGEAMAWKQISDTVGVFFLMVPDPLKAEAVRIIKKDLIKNVRLCTYKIIENKLKFVNLP